MIVNVAFNESKQSIAVNFKENKRSIDANFKEVAHITEYIGGTPYTGSYEVTPSVEKQLLETAKKIMEKDVVIKSIPYYEVSNNTGGVTVTIGKEV